MTDTFARTVADGWGVADSGAVWAHHSGDATDLDVDGSRGTFTLDTQMQTTIKADAETGEIEGSFVFSFGQPWTGNVNRLFAYLRANAALSEFYALRLEHTSGQRIDLLLFRGGTPITGGVTVVSGASFEPGAEYAVKFSLIGSAFKVKVWKVGTAEPGAWHLEATDAVIPADAVHTCIAFGFQRVSTNTFFGTVDSIAYYRPAVPSTTGRTRSGPVAGRVHSELEE